MQFRIADTFTDSLAKLTRDEQKAVKTTAFGVRLTGKLWPPTTHVIDPEVDEARWYLAQDLATSQRLIRAGLAKGVGLSTEDKPQYNLLGDPYYTDGLRLVAIFTAEPTAYDEIDFLVWEEPRDIRFLQSGDD